MDRGNRGGKKGGSKGRGRAAPGQAPVHHAPSEEEYYHEQGEENYPSLTPTPSPSGAWAQPRGNQQSGQGQPAQFRGPEGRASSQQQEQQFQRGQQQFHLGQQQPRQHEQQFYPSQQQPRQQEQQLKQQGQQQLKQQGQQQQPQRGQQPQQIQQSRQPSQQCKQQFQQSQSQQQPQVRQQEQLLPRVEPSSQIPSSTSVGQFATPSSEPHKEPISTKSVPITEQSSSSRPPEASRASTDDMAVALVTEMEKIKLEQELFKYGNSWSKCQYKPPKRPGFGTKGRLFQVYVNFFNIAIPRDLTFFMYDVSFDPDVNRREERVKLIETMKPLLLKENFPERLPVIFPLYDTNKTLYSNISFPNVVKNGSMTITVDSGPAFGPTSKFKLIKITVKEVAKIHTDDLHVYIDPKQSSSSTEIPQDAIRVVDLLIKEVYKSVGFALIGRSMINAQRDTFDYLPDGAVLVNGVYSSVRPQDSAVRLNIDKTQSSFYDDVFLPDLFSTIYLGGQRISGPWRQADFLKFKNQVKRLRVITNYNKTPDGKTYERKFTIFGFSPEGADRLMIAEKKISTAQYYKDQYGIDLKFPYLPCVKVSDKKATYIPLELCKLLPYQKTPNSNSKIVREIIKKAAVSPAIRRAQINDLMKPFLSPKSQQILNSYKINVDMKMLQTVARILDPPTLEAKGSAPQSRQGKWDFKRSKFLQIRETGVVKFYMIVCDRRYAQSAQNDLYNFSNLLVQSARDVGYQFITTENDYAEIDALFELEDVIRKNHDKYNLFVIVLPRNNSDEFYAKVKCLGDIELGVATQCVKSINLESRKCNGQYTGNLMFKINAKLGGINWQLDGGLACWAGFAVNEPVMLLGADVTHPAPTGDNIIKRSIAAVVGSVDKNGCIYNTHIAEQESRRGTKTKMIVETILNLKEMFKQLVKDYYRNTNRKPNRIIFYRDGVSEGQFQTVLNEELQAMKEAVSELSEYDPFITYIVVQKRHHTRIFPVNAQDGIGRMGNIPPGTVVDRNIVHPWEFDFYLCSHEGIQGTSKPTHYYVLFDENQFGADELQAFTFCLCHLYMRCPRSVSIPAPTYYAHLAAFRARACRSEPGSTEASETTSVHSGAVGGSTGDKALADLNVHSNMKQKGYYC